MVAKGDISRLSAEFNKNAELEEHRLANTLYFSPRSEWLDRAPTDLASFELRDLANHISWLQNADFFDFKDAVKDVIRNGTTPDQIAEQFPHMTDSYSNIIKNAFNVREHPDYEPHDLIRMATDEGKIALLEDKSEIATQLHNISERGTAANIYPSLDDAKVTDTPEQRLSVLDDFTSDKVNQVSGICAEVRSFAHEDFKMARRALAAVNERIDDGVPQEEIAKFVDTTVREHLKDDRYTEIIKAHAEGGDSSSQTAAIALTDRGQEWVDGIKDSVRLHSDIPKLAESLHGLPPSEWADRIPPGMSPSDLSQLQNKLIDFAEADLSKAQATMRSVNSIGRNSPIHSEAQAIEVKDRLFRTTDNGVAGIRSDVAHDAYRDIIRDFVTPDPNSNIPPYATRGELAASHVDHQSQLKDQFETIKQDIQSTIRDIATIPDMPAVPKDEMVAGTTNPDHRSPIIGSSLGLG
jgi:hypothetical protein